MASPAPKAARPVTIVTSQGVLGSFGERLYTKSLRLQDREYVMGVGRRNLCGQGYEIRLATWYFAFVKLGE